MLDDLLGGEDTGYWMLDDLLGEEDAGCWRPPELITIDRARL